jgi:hypothetical protein
VFERIYWPHASSASSMAERTSSKSATASCSRGKVKCIESFFNPVGARASQYEEYVPIIEAKAGSGRRAKLPDMRVTKGNVPEDTAAADLSEAYPLQDVDEDAVSLESDECEAAAEVPVKKKIDKDSPDAPWRMCATFSFITDALLFLCACFVSCAHDRSAWSCATLTSHLYPMSSLT